MTGTALVTEIMRDVAFIPPWAYTYKERPGDLLEVRASELEAILLSAIPTPDEWTLAMQVELEEARKEIVRLRGVAWEQGNRADGAEDAQERAEQSLADCQRDNVIFRACANGYAENALRALMKMTGSFNSENPWLGITASVALLQAQLAATNGNVAGLMERLDRVGDHERGTS